MTNGSHTIYLLKANIRQNLFRHLLWLVILVGMFAAMAGQFNNLFGTTAEITTIMTTLKTPALVSLFGEVTATKPYTTADVFSSEMVIFMGMFMIFMNISLAVRNTRSQEDSGLLEMIRSRKVGRVAPIYATLIEILIINSLMGGLFILSLAVGKLNGATIAGDVLMGVSFAVVGILFGCISIFLAQLTSSSRGAYFFSYGLFGIFYLLRMLTDMTNPKYTWLSPVGWIQKTEIYTNNNWLPIFVMVFSSFICLFAGIKIASRRDIGSGIFTPHSGRSQASWFLNSPLRLLLKIERNSMLGWMLGGLILGAAYGSVFNSIGDIIGTNPTYKKILGVSAINDANRDLLLNYLNMLALFFVAIAAISGLIVIFRLNSDEKKGYLEILHSKAISKTKLANSYFLIGIGLSSCVFILTLSGAFFIGNATISEPLALKYFWQMLIGYLPTVLFFIGIGIFFCGVAPKLSLIAWLYLLAGLLVKMFGPLLNLSEKFENFSPLGWMGKIPVEEVNYPLAVGLLAAFLVMITLSLIAYNKRDVI
ncbi:ABC transporter permease [Enterococcus alishanensis]